MHKLQHKGLDKTIIFLDAINCQYKIIDELGNVHTSFTWNEKIRKKKKSFYPYGKLVQHTKQYVDELQVGKVVTIPLGEFDVKRLASSVSSYLAQKFGKKSCSVHQTPNGIECLRFF